MTGFSKPLFRLCVLVIWLRFYRLIYRHFDRHPLSRLSLSIYMYREQSALPQ